MRVSRFTTPDVLHVNIVMKVVRVEERWGTLRNIEELQKALRELYRALKHVDSI
jgi:hypothetical protein